MAGMQKKEARQFTEATDPVWNAGVYARLSVDYHGQKNESIDTQIEIAKDYIRRSENMVFSGCYIDLGKTGTNFKREGFHRMLADIRSHKINCVVVKDFSRFGRNYIETGNYLEKIFPFFHIRFISVTDGYDSFHIQGENDMFAVNLKNIVNELYAKDCAEKVRAIKKSKLEQGCYIGGIPSYGYCVKWEDGKRVLSPEEGTSDVVKCIYELFEKGNSIGAIISWLYRKRIYRPTDYRKFGRVHCEEGGRLKQWADQTIRTILTNQVYIGMLVQLKAGEMAYRSGGRHQIGTEEMIIIEHAHKPVIGEDLFYRVASKIEKRRKKALPKDTPPEDAYKDLAYCGECNCRLKRLCILNTKSYNVSVRLYSYGCPNISRIDYLKCASHFMSGNTINRILLQLLRIEFALSEVCMETLVDFNQRQAGQREKEIEEKKNRIQANIQEADIGMSSLYIKYRAGKIGRDEFIALKAGKEAEKSNLRKELEKQDAAQQRIGEEVGKINQFICGLWEGSTGMDRQLAQFLVKKITVYKDKQVEIIFNFDNVN